MRTKGSCRFAPYYKVEWYDATALCWRVIQKAFSTEEQRFLFQNEPTIDTVFRPTKKNRFVTDGIVNARAQFFNGKKQLASKFSAKTYMGKCGTCQEMCGVNVGTHHPNRPGILRQEPLSLQLQKQDPPRPAPPRPREIALATGANYK